METSVILAYRGCLKEEIPTLRRLSGSASGRRGFTLRGIGSRLSESKGAGQQQARANRLHSVMHVYRSPPCFQK